MVIHYTCTYPIIPERNEPMKIEVDTTRLYSTQVSDYATDANRWWKAGFRTALELLDLELPAGAERQAPGRKSLSAAMKAYHANNPTEAAKANQRKIEANLKRSQARAEARNG